MGNEEPRPGQPVTREERLRILGEGIRQRLEQDQTDQSKTNQGDDGSE